MRQLAAALLIALPLTACNRSQSSVDKPGYDEALVDRYLRTQDRTGEADAAGMRTMPSGLKYQVIEQGTGRSPGYNDTVVVQYRGWNEAGQLFDSSYQRGRPATFAVDGVIKGWTEALRHMKEGATWRIVVPPFLGYGAKGNGPAIGPNETLTFEIQLLQVR